MSNTHSAPFQRPEPSSTKKLSIITLVRIFVLTHSHQSLVREITTPSLPAFITICLKLIGAEDNAHTQHLGSSESLLSVALWAYSELLPLFPAAFRPFVAQLRASCLPLTAPISSSWLSDDSADQGSRGACSGVESHRARQVIVLLCGCAPKNTQSQEWAQSLTAIIAKAHGTADLVFRALKEDWVSSGHDNRLSVPTAASSSRVVQSDETDSELPNWVGIDDGLERLDGLLLTAQAHLAYPSSSALAIPTGKILDLIDRIVSALPPSQDSPDGVNVGTSTNPEVSRDEREALWTWLPKLHVTALSIIEHLVARLEQDSMSIHLRLLNQVLWLFDHEQSLLPIRQAAYRVLAGMLAHCASGIPRPINTPLVSVLKICCQDILHSEPISRSSTEPASAPNATNADAYFRGAGSGAGAAAISRALFSDVRPVAEGLLVAALMHLPADVLTFAVRSEIDRTTVLAQSEPLLKASTLNPPLGHDGKGPSSVLPLLARRCPLSQNAEAIIRPRMPLIQPTAAVEHSELKVNGTGEVDETDAWPSRPMYFGKSREDHGNLAMDGHQTTERSFEPLPSLPIQLEEPEVEAQTAMPAKRPFEPEIEQSVSATAVPREQPLNLDVEPPLKRTRTNSGDIESPLDTLGEHKAPEANISFQKDPVKASAVAAPETTEPLVDLSTTNLDKDGDNSDESSIPEIDPTMATDDEEDDEAEEI